MGSYPHAASLTQEDADRVVFALRLVNLEAMECICDERDNPNDHREDCPRWRRNEEFLDVAAFDALALRIEQQQLSSLTTRPADSMERIATAFERIADNSEIIAAEITRRIDAEAATP